MTRKLSLWDRMRIENAVQTYDFWLEMRGAGTAEYRPLRRELRANLMEAARERGVDAALDGVGSPRELARAVTPLNPIRARWRVGFLWAVMSFGLIWWTYFFTAIAFLDGVKASGVRGHDVRGGVFPWFGSEFFARVDSSGGFSLGGTLGPLLWVIPVVVLLGVAQPWRTLRRRPSHG